MVVEEQNVSKKALEQPIYVVEERPQPILETTVVDNGTKKKKVQRKRTIKTKKGYKQEITEILTTQEEANPKRLLLYKKL